MSLQRGDGWKGGEDKKWESRKVSNLSSSSSRRRCEQQQQQDNTLETLMSCHALLLVSLFDMIFERIDS
jgi:hypothetical protein